MAYQLWAQDNFSKGELSPFMYARSQVEQYYNGLKQAQNVLNYPTGAAGKRFGTFYQATLQNIEDSNQVYFQTFQFLDVAIYQLVFTPLKLYVYQEGILVRNPITTIWDEQALSTFSTTVIDNLFRVCSQNNPPYDITATLLNPLTINGISGNNYTTTSSIGTVGRIYPFQFFTTGTVPTTVPPVKVGVYYYLNIETATSFSLYPTAQDAAAKTNPFIVINIGTGTNTIQTLVVGNPVLTPFRNKPFFDFDGGYDAITFTPSAKIGTPVTVTLSSGITPALTSRFVGGAFFGNGGSGTILTVASGTSFTMAVQTPFNDTTPIQGSLALLAEPAWSTARGFPTKCSSYQSRALFANTFSLQNGFWASVLNDYGNFTNYTNDDDDGIAWYPTSNDVNVIRFIVAYRSITVHTNSGIFSTPLSDLGAITPSTFTLQLQDSTPADVLQPQAIDNQIIILSGDDVHTMLWDGINNAYTSNIVSIVNEQVIRSPVDEGVFADLTRAGSRYVFIINESGSMAVYQTLQAEQVSGFTPCIMEQSYGDAKFLQTSSSFNGRCWFVVQREIADPQVPIAITGFSLATPTVPSTLTAVSSNFSTTKPTAILFSTSGSLPASTPSLELNIYYWAIGVTADTFNVYASQEDAMAGVNAYKFTSAGTSSLVQAWTLIPIFTLEELSQDIKLDCAVKYDGVPASTISTGALFNAQNVKMLGDGFGFDAVGVNDSVTFESHGDLVDVSLAYIGFPINYLVEPMPIAAPPGQQTTLTKPKHIRTARFMFNNTVGGTINGVPIALEPFDQADIGNPPVPARGFVEVSIMQGWDDFNKPSFIIEHNEPFDIQFLGVFYSVDI